jgi:hypothetical protein
MNEIYVTGPPRSEEGPNSDQIFYTRHVDGPWGFVPFVSVYRCIVGMDKNLLVSESGSFVHIYASWFMPHGSCLLFYASWFMPHGSCLMFNFSFSFLPHVSCCLLYF